MCKYMKVTNKTPLCGGVLKTMRCTKNWKHGSGCPANTNKDCEIVPAKPKKDKGIYGVSKTLMGLKVKLENTATGQAMKPKKDKTVNAWAWINLKGNIVAATIKPCGSFLPCTITISADVWEKARPKK